MKRTFYLVFTIILVFCATFVPQNFFIVKADAVEFDKSNVLDDLTSSSVNGKPFDLLDYPYDETKNIRVINFVEYCYSHKANKRGNYGLYVYVYNPKGIDISENSGQNKIQMAVSWVKNADGVYVANRYEKFNLKFCNKAEKKDYLGLFYKFKVIDRIIDGKSMVERVNSSERRYDVSGIELLTNGSPNATEYTVGGIYKFSGYSKGFGPTDENTLSCDVTDLETLKLNLHSTHYRTEVSSLGKGHYNEVNTVYFSVPNAVFTRYGNLQKIRAEWWEYKTKKAFVSNDEAFYNEAVKYTGVDVGPFGDRDKVPFSLTAGANVLSQFVTRFAWTYNVDEGNAVHTFSSDERQTILPFVFYSPATEVDGIFKFLYTKPVAGSVNSDKVKEYIYGYKNNLGNGYVDCNGRSLSKDLFLDTVDEGRTRGYNDKTIDLGDSFDLNSYDSNHSWWDKLFDYGFSWPSTNEQYENVPPIYVLKNTDVLGETTNISKNLLVNSDDVATLQSYYASETLKNNSVVLFRFANTDYYSEQVVSDKVIGYIAQLTCFFDFDIIELTFNKDGVYYVIPAVSNPIDIVNGLTPPAQSLEWWKIILGLVGLILLLFILAPVLPYVFKAIFYVISLPFKLVKKIAKRTKSNRYQPKITKRNNGYDR